MDNIEKILRAIRKINSKAEMVIEGEDIDTCKITWSKDTTPITKAKIKTKMTVVEDEENEKQTNLENNKTSGKAKLKAGEALTDAEISALFGD